MLPRAISTLITASALAAAQYTAVDLGSTPAAIGTVAANSGPTLTGHKYTPADPANQHAYLWNGTASPGTDLNPAGWFRSQAQALSGAQQAGWGMPAASTDSSAGVHALVWFASAASFVDLHPNSLAASIAMCTTGTLQGGYGNAPAKSAGKGVKIVPPSHALIWRGSASTVTDLNPQNYAESKIWGCSGDSQTGYASITAGGFYRAMLWAGSAKSAIDLHPAGFTTSVAFSVSGAQQAGYGISSANSNLHAILWNGTASSAIDLHPAGFASSIAYATNGSNQVGEATDSAFPQRKHAIAWAGTSASAVDLNQFLPPGFTDAHASSIDSAGNIVGWAADTTGAQHAIQWTPVP